MKIENWNYVLYVHSRSFSRQFRRGFMTYKEAYRNLQKYKIAGFRGELHDNFKGLVLETF